jgi:putative transposase
VSIVTDKLRSYSEARRELIPETIHDTTQYANNRAELPHEPARVREQGMRNLKSMEKAQRFIGVHAAVYNLFNIGRHLVSAESYRFFWLSAFASLQNPLAVQEGQIGFSRFGWLTCQYCFVG